MALQRAVAERWRSLTGNRLPKSNIGKVLRRSLRREAQRQDPA
jgi:hypothetical protein